MNLGMFKLNKYCYWWGFLKWNFFDFNFLVGGDVIIFKGVSDLLIE